MTEYRDLEKIRKLPRYDPKDMIVNYTVERRIKNGTPKDFFIKVYNGEYEIIEELLDYPLSIPRKTAPSPDFYDKDYKSLRQIFNDLKENINEKYVDHRDNEIYTIISSLASMASYFREVFYTSPYIDFFSPIQGCGKTTAMKVMVFTSFYGIVLNNPTEAVIFRLIDDTHCVLGLDNIENILSDPKVNENLIALLNSSYSQDVPCMRAERINERWVVIPFDGYGIKAFTHVRQFPSDFKALKSRTIPIIMQKGNPEKVLTPQSLSVFTDIRDRLYYARLLEHDKVERTYNDLVKSKALEGRMGDLYLPLLTIAKLVDNTIYQKIIDFVREQQEETIEEELDVWSKQLLLVIEEKELFGLQSSQDIRPLFAERLRSLRLLSDRDIVYTRTISRKLKSLGFGRETKKTTDNKTWWKITIEDWNEKMEIYNVLPELDGSKTIKN